MTIINGTLGTSSTMDISTASVEYINYILLASALVTHTAAACILIAKKNKKVMDWLLMNLNLTELLFVTQELVLCSFLHQNDFKTIRLSVNNVLIFSINLAIVLITLDRIAAVRFPLKYNTVVSNKTVFPVMVLSWLLSLHQCAIVQLGMKATNLFIVSWVSIMVVFLFASYTYIIRLVNIRRRRLSCSTSKPMRANIKYHVPLFIVLSFIVLVLVPTLVVVFGHLYMNAWIDIIYKTNFTVDAAIYLFTARKCRRSSRSLIKSSKSQKPGQSMQTTEQC